MNIFTFQVLNHDDTTELMEVLADNLKIAFDALEKEYIPEYKPKRIILINEKNFTTVIKR